MPGLSPIQRDGTGGVHVVVEMNFVLPCVMIDTVHDFHVQCVTLIIHILLTNMSPSICVFLICTYLCILPRVRVPTWAILVK